MDYGITVEKLRLTDAPEVKLPPEVFTEPPSAADTEIWIPAIGQGAIGIESRKNNKIICISGCHVLFDTSYRILARAVALESRAGLSRYHFNSLPFYYHIQLQVEWAKQQGGTEFFITTNKNRKFKVEDTATVSKP